MRWLNQHLGWVITAGGGLLLLVSPVLKRIVRGAWKAVQLYRARQDAMHETADRLVDGYQRETTLIERQRDRAQQECETLKERVADLRLALVEEAEKVKRRDDVNEQDRFTIRLLKRRLRENHIEYYDIEELVKKAMKEKWMSE